MRCKPCAPADLVKAPAPGGRGPLRRRGGGPGAGGRTVAPGVRRPGQALSPRGPGRPGGEATPGQNGLLDSVSACVRARNNGKGASDRCSGEEEISVLNYPQTLPLSSYNSFFFPLIPAELDRVVVACRGD